MRSRPVPRARVSILIAAAVALGGGGALRAQPAEPAQASPQVLERVEVTGSSIKRIEGETALPVQVLTREDIARTGAASVEQLLQTVSAVASSGALAAASVSGATTGGISSVSLRGLTSLRTLVLINGRRVSPYGLGLTNDSVSVDVNSIPLAAIDRVEVLKDGASSIYGSDAIGGVINFILRRDFKGVELTAEYGDTTRGGGAITRFAAAFGTGDLARDRYNVMLVASYAKEDGLFGRDRAFSSTSIFPQYNNDTTSGNSFPGNLLVPGVGDLAPDGAFVNPGYPNCAPSSVSPLYTAAGLQICRFDTAPRVSLFPDAERAGFFAAGRLLLTPEVELFAEASFNRNEQRNVIQPVPISEVFALPPNHPLFGVAPYNGFSTILLQPSSPFYPTAFIRGLIGPTAALPDVSVLYRAVVNGDRDITDIAESPRLALGVRGALAGWDFDTALLYSASKVTEQVNDGFPSLTQILPLLNSGQVNFFGPNSPAIDAQLRATNFTGNAFVNETSLTGITAKGAREMLALPGGPLAVALGVEARRETFTTDPSPAIQAGDISGYGGNFLPVDRARSVRAVFAEANVPIIRQLEANLSVRYDDYEGTGSKTTPKVAVRWQPVRSLLLRSAFGQGFRAPSLADLYSPNTTGVTPNGLSDPLRCPTTGLTTDCNTQFTIINGGNAGLKPEKSDNVTLGFVFEPTSNVSVAVDAFRIDLKETIVNGVAAAVILNDLARYGSLVQRGPASPAFPGLPGPIVQIDQTNINLGQTKVAGFDTDIRVGIPAGGLGRFTVGLTGTYFSKFDTQNPDGSFTGNVNQINVTTGGVIPRWKHYLAVNWQRGPWTATLAQNYQGSYVDFPASFDDPTDPAFVPRRVGRYEVYDAQATYSGFKSLRLTLGVRNLFDRDPPYTNGGGQIWFQSYYDPTYADPRGRFFYVRGTYKF